MQSFLGEGAAGGNFGGLFPVALRLSGSNVKRYLILATATSSQRATRSCSDITAADNAALVSFQQSYNLEGEFP